MASNVAFFFKQLLWQVVDLVMFRIATISSLRHSLQPLLQLPPRPLTDAVEALTNVYKVRIRIRLILYPLSKPKSHW